MSHETIQIKAKRTDEELNTSVLKKIHTGEELDEEELEYKIRSLQEQKEDNNPNKLPEIKKPTRKPFLGNYDPNQ